MHEQRSLLRATYETLLSSRTVQPDGRPLYAYRFTRDEFDRTADALRASAPGFLQDRHGGALFVAYTSEWYRRVREGGHWDWIHPLGSLGVRYHSSDPGAQVGYSSVREAALVGLRMWGRSPKRGLSILDAVIAESGFPASALRQGPRLANWLKRSVLAIEAGFAPDDAVAAESWRAPESLVPVLSEAAVLLCRAVVAIRAAAGGNSGDADLVRRLELVRPDWRSDLPFDVEEQDVRILVDDMIRVQRPDSRGLNVVRHLRPAGEGTWTAHAEISLQGSLDHRGLPDQLRTVAEQYGRLRLRPGGALADRPKVIAALERVTDDNSDVWEVRPLVQGCDLPLGLDEEFRLQALASEGVVAEFTAPAGDPCNGPAIVMEPVGELEFGATGELLVLGSSPMRSRAEWLVLAIDEFGERALQIEGTRRDLGSLTDGRLLVAFTGTAEMDIGGERLRWRAGDDKREAARLYLTGDVLWHVKQRVFRGCPSVWLDDGETAMQVAPREIIWRPIGSHVWSTLRDREPFGGVEFALRRKGVLLAWTRLDIVPTQFRMESNSKDRVLRLSGLAGAHVAAAASGPLPSRQEIDAVVVDLANLVHGAMLELRLRWVNTIALTLPDPVSEPILLGTDGSPCSERRLSVDRLSGYRLLTPSRWTLVFELRRAGVRPIFASRSVDGLVPLAAFSEVARALLGSCHDLDAFVRLSWIGREDRIAEVGWYDIDQSLVLPENSSPSAELLKSTASWDLKAFSLSDPQAGVAHPPVERAVFMSDWLRTNLAEGPWLLSGATQDGRRLRPKVLDDTAQISHHHGFAAALREPSRGRRDAALDSYFGNTDVLPVEDLRALIDLAVQTSKVEIPYASIDALRSLARAPGKAISVLVECVSFAEREAVLRLQSELPFLWCSSAVNDWIAAVGARRDRLSARLIDIGQDAALAHRTVTRGLMEVLDLNPALRVHVQAALLVNGISLGEQPELAFRLNRTLGSLESLAQDLIKRHGDGAERPPTLGLSNTIGGPHPFWERYDQDFADVLAAPMVIAGIAMGEIPSKGLLTACRAAWLFDRDYFEAAVVELLFERAHS